jgi:hypothetical protein
MVWQVELVGYVAVWKKTVDEQSGRMASDMEVHIKQRCIIEFLHAEKNAPADNRRRSLNIYGDQTVDVSTVRWCTVNFSSGDSDVTGHVPGGPAQPASHEIKSSV